jgi:N-methylhydantoinase A
MHAVERGVDLRGVSLIAFGGAGPVHACGVAELLESPRVIFPVNASVLSAFGTLVSPVRVDLARSLVRVLDDAVADERDALLDEMRAEGRRVLPAAGIGEADIRFRYGFDARYVGQGNEITIWVGEGPTWPVDTATALERFAEEYERVYGLRIPDVAAEVVTWRVAVWAAAAPFEVAELAPGGGAATPHHTRPVRWVRGADPIDTPVYRRPDLGVGATFRGPAIVEERETTSVIRPGWTAEVHADGSIIATRLGAGEAAQ